MGVESQKFTSNLKLYEQAHRKERNPHLRIQQPKFLSAFSPLSPNLTSNLDQDLSCESNHTSLVAQCKQG
jgi:hypothetical protein